MTAKRSGPTAYNRKPKPPPVAGTKATFTGKAAPSLLGCGFELVPRCGRVSSSKHWKCLYCGQEFQKPVMG